MLVYRFPDVLALTGIVEIVLDVFVVIAGNYTLNSGSTAGFWAVWRLDLNGWDGILSEATSPLLADYVFKITDIIKAAYLKGISLFS